MNMGPLIRNSTKHYSKDFCDGYYIFENWSKTANSFLLIKERQKKDRKEIVIESDNMQDKEKLADFDKVRGS